MVRQEFPSVRLYRDEVSRSVVVQRNRGARLARRDRGLHRRRRGVPSPYTIAQTLTELHNPAVGAIAIPSST